MTPTAPNDGVDRLVKTVETAGIGPGGNVYAELGSTWYLILRRPAEAAHVLGKLLKSVGPDRIVWGTDSIWYGSPQPLIDAFRAVPDPRVVPGEVRLPRPHGGDEGEDPQPQCPPRLPTSPTLRSPMLPIHSAPPPRGSGAPRWSCGGRSPAEGRDDPSQRPSVARAVRRKDGLHDRLMGHAAV